MRLVAGLAVGAVLVVGAPAAAQTFDNFQIFCLEGTDDPLTAARQVGWLEQEGVNQAVASTGQTGVTILTQPNADGQVLPEMLMGGEIILPDGNTSNSCSAKGSDTREILAARMTAWAGFPAAGNSIWLFTRGQDGMRERSDLLRVSPDSLGPVIDESGPLHLVQIGERNTGPFILLTLFR